MLVTLPYQAVTCQTDFSVCETWILLRKAMLPVSRKFVIPTQFVIWPTNLVAMSFCLRGTPQQGNGQSVQITRTLNVCHTSKGKTIQRRPDTYASTIMCMSDDVVHALWKVRQELHGALGFKGVHPQLLVSSTMTGAERCQLPTSARRQLLSVNPAFLLVFAQWNAEGLRNKEPEQQNFF